MSVPSNKCIYCGERTRSFYINICTLCASGLRSAQELGEKLGEAVVSPFTTEIQKLQSENARLKAEVEVLRGFLNDIMKKYDDGNLWDEMDIGFSSDLYSRASDHLHTVMKKAKAALAPKENK